MFQTVTQAGPDEPGLLEMTGGMVADCETCGEPISASAGYGALCQSCEHDDREEVR